MADRRNKKADAEGIRRLTAECGELKHHLKYYGPVLQVRQSQIVQILFDDACMDRMVMKK
jgi:hypothetical protein